MLFEEFSVINSSISDPKPVLTKVENNDFAVFF